MTMVTTLGMLTSIIGPLSLYGDNSSIRGLPVWQAHC